ncbi:hypothetical protein SAMN06269301_1980 [Geobacter sp. DSM 9736]|nr:hypothetical protein SAMN06269301_1980 [Geobacter sp. DSM 9736]
MVACAFLQATMAMSADLSRDPAADAVDNKGAPSSTEKNNPHESPQKFKDHVKGKYSSVKYAESDVKKTKHGLSGNVWLSGAMVPKKQIAIDLAKEPDRHLRARAVAKAFMEDEAELLGISKPTEMRESKIFSAEGGNGTYVTLIFDRFINGLSLGNAIQITIGPQDNVTSVKAEIISVPPEAYEATKKTTLSEDDVKQIIEKDHKQQNVPVDIEEVTLNKLVIADPPYVVWTGQTIWAYEINAFTGEILQKLPLWRK